VSNEVYIGYELETPAGDLLFNPAGAVNGFYLENVQSTASLRTAMETRPQADGGLIYPSFRNVRQVVLQGWIKAWQPGDTETEVLEARQLLMDELEGKTDSLKRADGILKYTPTGLAARRVHKLRLMDDVVIQGNVGIRKTYQITLISPDPIAYDETVSDETRTNTGNVTCVNDGNVDVFPVIRVEGPWTNSSPVVVTNVTTGLSWTVEDTTASDTNYIEMDHGANTLVNHNGDSFIRYLNPGISDLFPLVPGSNTVSLAGSGMTASTTFTVTWRNGWV
jgi:hypothetical protein